jgi:Cell division protein FtsQ
VRRRPAIVLAVVLLALAAGWFFIVRDEQVEPHLTVELPIAMIGSGDEAVGVSPDGRVLSWQGPPEADSLPVLSIEMPPQDGRLAGPALQQAKVLGAAPGALRSCIAASSYGETGVVVELRAGIELDFGDAARLEQKWATAAAVLADTTITALDYVNLHAPNRPALRGSGQILPSPDEPAAGGCGG